MSESKGLVLVVEDEKPIADILRMYLTRDGFGVHVESDGIAGLSAAKTLHPVAIILDVGLPGIDGVEVCKDLRNSGIWTPILFCTARDDEVDRIFGALADATRRDILTRVLQHEQSVSHLAEGYAMSFAAVFSAAARGRMRWSTWRGLGWEGDLAAMREGGRGPAPVIVVDSWVWIDSGTTTGIST